MIETRSFLESCFSDSWEKIINNMASLRHLKKKWRSTTKKQTIEQTLKQTGELKSMSQSFG